MTLLVTKEAQVAIAFFLQLHQQAVAAVALLAIQMQQVMREVPAAAAVLIQHFLLLEDPAVLELQIKVLREVTLLPQAALLQQVAAVQVQRV